MRTRCGAVFAAVHLEASVGRVAMCAESIAVGMGAAAGDTDISVIVAVNRAGEIVAPCGICRELLSGYAPDAEVIVPGAEGPERVRITTLLPNKPAGWNGHGRWVFNTGLPVRLWGACNASAGSTATWGRPCQSLPTRRFSTGVLYLRS